MDLDFVTLRSFDDNLFWNFVPKEDDGRVFCNIIFEKNVSYFTLEKTYFQVTGSAIHFEHGHPILVNMMTYLSSSYHPDKWVYSGIQICKYF